MKNPIAELARKWLGRRAPDQLNAGELYSVEAAGRIAVAKVLRPDESLVNVRVYTQRFSNRPTEISPADLSIRRADDPEGLGVGHIPISREVWASWAPKLLHQVSVTDEELDGIRQWEADEGGVWTVDPISVLEASLPGNR